MKIKYVAKNISKLKNVWLYTYVTDLPSDFVKKQIAYKMIAILVISLIEIMLAVRQKERQKLMNLFQIISN